MNCQHYWKDSWLVTLTHRPGPCQTPHHSLADLRTGVPPIAEQQLWAWQAPGDPQCPVFSHTLWRERPVGAGLGETGSPCAKWICLFYDLFCLRYNYSGAQLVWNQGNNFSYYTETVTWLGPPFTPQVPFGGLKSWACLWFGSLSPLMFSYSMSSALPGTGNVSFPCQRNTSNYNLNL